MHKFRYSGIRPRAYKGHTKENTDKHIRIKYCTNGNTTQINDYLHIFVCAGGPDCLSVGLDGFVSLAYLTYFIPVRVLPIKIAAQLGHDVRSLALIRTLCVCF